LDEAHEQVLRLVGQQSERDRRSSDYHATEDEDELSLRAR
jgi:hypothetical protein